MLKVFSASSDEVVASIGTLNFCTEASDSPSLVRRLEATLPKAFTTSSLLDASPCSLASVSPFPQFTACNPTMYWLPKREIDPASSALLPVRKQISCATSRVTRSLGGRPIKRSVSPTLRSESTLRNGDCSKSTASPCFKAPSKTASPVVLPKSANTTVSFSVNGFAERERKK